MLINLKGMLSESRQSQKIESYIHNSTNMAFLKKQNYKYRKPSWLSGLESGW